MVVRRHPGLEIAAIIVLLFSAMLDPLLTFGLAVAVLAGGFVLVFLSREGRTGGR